MPTKLTMHFTVEELTTTDREEFKQLNYKEGCKIASDLLTLAQFCEAIRRIIQSPMIITSGFRCAELNKAIGGSPTSQHCFGQAVDFIPAKLSAQDAFALIRQSDLVYGQLILEKRGAGHILHASIGTKRENMYSPEQGKYDKILV